jgi:hypothetical protein
MLVRSQAHGLATNDPIIIEGVEGPNFALANGEWAVTVVDEDTFTIPLSITSGSYQAGGTWTYGVEDPRLRQRPGPRPSRR